MPNVPVDNLPSVMPGQRPDARLSPNAPIEAFGGGPGVAEAYGQAHGLAGDAGKIAYNEFEEANRTKIDDAVVALSQLQQKVLKDPNTGALTARGEAAIPASQQAMEDFKKGAQEIDGTLTNSAQKDAFRSKVTEYHVQTSGILSTHVMGQIQEKKAQSLAASAEQSGNAAESFATTDLSAVKSNLDDQEKKIRELSAFNGLDSNATEYAVRKGLSATNLRVLSMLAATGNDLVAKHYYDSNPSVYIDQDAIHAAKLVKRGSTLGEATRLSDSAFAGKVEGSPVEGYGGYTPGVKTIGDLQIEGQKIDDPEVRQEFMRLGRQRIDDALHDRHQASTDVFDEISKQMQDPANVNKSPIDLATPDQWENQLTPAHRDALLGMARKERVTDDATRVDWWAQMADPRKVAAMTVADLTAKYLQHMSVPDAERAYGEWEKARKEVNGDPFKPSEVKSAYTDKEMILASMAEVGAAGIAKGETMSKLNGDQKAAFADLFDKVDNAWMAFAGRNNGKISDADRKRILAEQAAGDTEVTVPDYPEEYGKPGFTSGYNAVAARRMKFSEMTGDDRKNFIIESKNIPAAVLKDMTDFIVGRGKVVTQDKLQRMRRARLLGNDAEVIKIANE
jgi:hypothetical protein